MKSFPHQQYHIPMKNSYFILQVDQLFKIIVCAIRMNVYRKFQFIVHKNCLKVEYKCLNILSNS